MKKYSPFILPNDFCYSFLIGSGKGLSVILMAIALMAGFDAKADVTCEDIWELCTERGCEAAFAPEAEKYPQFLEDCVGAGKEKGDYKSGCAWVVKRLHKNALCIGDLPQIFQFIFIRILKRNKGLFVLFK